MLEEEKGDPCGWRVAWKVRVFVAQPCPTLCDPGDCSPPGSPVHGDSPGQNAGVGGHSLLQRIFPTQGSSQGLLLCRQILYCLSRQEALENSITFSASL